MTCFYGDKESLEKMYWDVCTRMHNAKDEYEELNNSDIKDNEKIDEVIHYMGALAIYQLQIMDDLKDLYKKTL